MKLYKLAGKFDDQQQYKYIIEAFMVSIPDGFNENNPIPPGPSMTVKNTSTIK